MHHYPTIRTILRRYLSSIDVPVFACWAVTGTRSLEQSSPVFNTTTAHRTICFLILYDPLLSPNPSFDTLHYFAFKAFQSFAADSFRISPFITLRQGLCLPPFSSATSTILRCGSLQYQHAIAIPQTYQRVDYMLCRTR
jgi:hypothetical protein